MFHVSANRNQIEDTFERDTFSKCPPRNCPNTDKPVTQSLASLGLEAGAGVGLEGVGEGAGGTEKQNGGAPGHLPLQVTSGAVWHLLGLAD